MTLRIQVVLPYLTNLPQDVATNTFHFDAVSVSPTVGAQTAMARLETFYNEAPPSPAVNPIATYISGVVNRSECRMIAYDLDDPRPRAPIFENEWTLGSATGTNLPNELAVCASYQADRAAGVPQARRRGRVFIGPLRAAAMASGSASSSPPPATALMDTLAGAMRRLRLASNGEVQWVGYSRTSGSAWVPSNGWVDNDFDVQRRREPRPTARTLWSAE
jgi:hypothetical protein